MRVRGWVRGWEGVGVDGGWCEGVRVWTVGRWDGVRGCEEGGGG